MTTNSDQNPDEKSLEVKQTDKAAELEQLFINNHPKNLSQEELFPGDNYQKQMNNMLASKEIVKDVFKVIERTYTGKRPRDIIPTGFRVLDMLLDGGFYSSELIVIAGRPKTGKTTFTLDLARHAAIESGCGVIIFSPCMPSSRVMFRMLTADSRIPWRVLSQGQSEEWARMTVSASKLSEAEIHVDDTGEIIISDLVESVKRLKKEHVRGPQYWLVIVDDLQLIRSICSQKRTKAEEFGEICQSLKNMARELDVSVLLISPIEENESGNSDRRPTLAALRGFGLMEQYADLILFLHRRNIPVHCPDPSQQEIAEVIVAKSRFGEPPAVVRLNFLVQYPTFENIERDLRIIKT
jgi:replicative DNA helicase